MKTKDILALLDAGYTKEEIEAMEAGEDPAEENQEQEQSGSEEPEDQAGVSPDQPDLNAINEFKSAVSEMQSTIGAIQTTLKAIQSQNAKSADSGAPASVNTAEKAIKDFFGAREKG